MNLYTTKPGGRRILRVEGQYPSCGYALHWPAEAKEKKELPTLTLRVHDDKGVFYEVQLSQADLDELNAKREQYSVYFERRGR